MGEVEVYFDIFYVTLSTFAMCPVWIKLMIVHRSNEEDYKKESRLISKLYIVYSVYFATAFLVKANSKCANSWNEKKACSSAAKNNTEK